ncbi:MAG: RHS repeat-associated core domain-containing protein, partial [Vulcanimicrobiota bacterium]
MAYYEHDEFGQQIAYSGSVVSPKTYVGGLGVHDDTADTGLLYMRQRHHDARLGRFLSRDPISFAGGLNLYGYVGGNPVNGVDPAGLQDTPI